MSPDIHHLLSAAADDEGRRPVWTDLEAIKAQGRRAVLRRRLITGVSGLAVAAVVGSVAVASGAIDLTRGGASDATSGVAAGGVAPDHAVGGSEPYSSTMTCGWAVAGPGQVDGALPDPNAPDPNTDPSEPDAKPPISIDPGDGTYKDYSGGGDGTTEPAAKGGGTSSTDGFVGSPTMPTVSPPPPGSSGYSMIGDRGATSDLASATPIGTPPSDGSTPPDPQLDCATVAYAFPPAVTDALAAAGYKATESGGVAGASDPGKFVETTAILTATDGAIGAAVVGSYESIDAVPNSDVRPGALWCGPTISDAADFTWDDTCTADTERAIVTHGHDADAQVLSGFFVRADGTVIGVSVSTRAYQSGGGDVGPGLATLPLDEKQLATLLTTLAGATE